LKAEGVLRKKFVNMSYVTLPVAEIMRCAWLWNCARLFNAPFFQVMGDKRHTTGGDTYRRWFCV
jgi:hypothetical protein